jgi:hypothetical protein
MSMKALITAIQTSLKNAATLSYVADDDIFITPDENILPRSFGLPAIGLKDGTIAREMRAQATASTYLWDVKYRVHVIIYVDMSAGETPVIGQASPSTKGVLDISIDIDAVLHENYQSISGIQDAYCVEEDESDSLGRPKQGGGWDIVMQKKRMTYEYQAQEIK